MTFAVAVLDCVNKDIGRVVGNDIGLGDIGIAAVQVQRQRPSRVVTVVTPALAGVVLSLPPGCRSFALTEPSLSVASAAKLVPRTVFRHALALLRIAIG